MDMINEAGKGEKTKYRLARSMKECMKTMSVDNITVKQITENCGVTRQTFYRNFMDKFDLINWYFDNYDDGGSFSMAAAYLTRGSGPVYEWQFRLFPCPCFQLCGY